MTAPASFDIVVSAENNHYIAWQAMVFHDSCVRTMNQAPIIVVHADDEELLPQFQLIQEHGGRVQRARNLRNERGWEYVPRNTPGTLRAAESDADYLVLCDPDMVFLRPLPLEDYRLSANQITLDKVPYLVVTDENRDSLSEPAADAGVDLAGLNDHCFSGGVPHIIPRALQESLARDWLDCIQCFEPKDTSLLAKPGMHLLWLSSMWGLAFALCRLEIEVVLTEWNIANCPGTTRLDAPDNQRGYLIHYCFGDDEFDKRNYMDQSGAESRVWHCGSSKNTVNEAIIRQIEATAKRFGITDADR